MPRTVVYLDGFNFYYGLLSGSTDCKWLDLQRLFVRLRQADEIVAVRYFTAFWPDESGERHKVYVQALGQSPLVAVELGRYKRKGFVCAVTDCSYSGRRRYNGFEEKETDVNIALRMLDDAYQGLCDTIVLVSGDSDLIPAVNMVKGRFPALRTVLYVPGVRKRFDMATELRAACHEARMFPEAMLRKFQLPAEVRLPGGLVARKPPTW